MAAVTQSNRFSSETLKLKDFRTALISLAGAVLALKLFNILISRINDFSTLNNFQGHKDLIGILDLRNGYSAEEVIETFNFWGADGIYHYLAIELIDVTIYFSAYRTLFVIVLNHLYSHLITFYPSLSFMKWLALGPTLLSWIDLLEDTCQVLVCLSYLHAKSVTSQIWWTNLIYLSSSINQIKWMTVKMALSLFVLSLIITVVGFFTRRKLETKSS